MIDFITVIIPTYNPDGGRLDQTIAALKAQSIDFSSWELMIVDNNSNPPVQIDLGWHPHHSIIIQQKQGLTHARVKGFESAEGEYIVMVDDDNVLDKDYLLNVLNIFTSNKKLGAIGGISEPLFETPPADWLSKFYSNLALRNMGESVLVTGWQNEYPPFAPIGAGMGLRKAALLSYINCAKSSAELIADRTAKSLVSGGDSDIILEILKSGWKIGYFPSLTLKHIIPKERTQPDYLGRLVNNMNKSWVQVLEKHKINPWEKIPRWTLPLRKTKAWFTCRAWKNQSKYIEWQGICGLFDGLSSI